MVTTHLKSTSKIIAEIQASSGKGQKKPDENQSFFIDELFEFVPADDLKKYKTSELAELSKDVYKSLCERKKGSPKIRVFPVNYIEEKCTAIEIINDDMPFLVDSIIEEINRSNLNIYMLAHPVINVERDKSGELKKISKLKGNNGSDTESIIVMLISPVHDKEHLGKIESGIKRVLQAVKYAVEDWRSCLDRVGATTRNLSSSADVLSKQLSGKSKTDLVESVQEIKDFLDWLKDGNFVFLGYVEYDFKSSKDASGIVRGTELGILKMGDPEILPKELNKSSARDVKNILAGDLIEITKANKKSLVHRPVHMDYIIIKNVDNSGNIIGEHRFLGLFTSLVYYQSYKNIPIIRKKIASIQKRSGFSSSGHSGKALVAVLEDFPRDELLQSSEDELFEAAIGVVVLATQPKVKLFTRFDDFGRFISCIIFIPREKMDTGLRKKMEKILCAAFNGTVSNHYTQISDSHLARVQVIIKTQPGKIPEYDLSKIEEELEAASKLWSDSLYEEFMNRFDPELAEKNWDKYSDAFSISYRNRFTSEDAYYDILQIEKVIKTGKVGFDIYESHEGDYETFEFKVFSPHSQVSLSKIMPIMENMGLYTKDEHTYLAKPKGFEDDVWIHRFRFKVLDVKKPSLKDIKRNFEESIERAWLGEMEDDAFNKLILVAGLKWRDVVMLRAYSKFLQQSTFPYSQIFIQDAVNNHPEIIKSIIEVFHAKFDPLFKTNREKTITALLEKIELKLGQVSNLAEDRVVRGFLELVNATLRTNFYQLENDAPKKYISFKFSSAKISWLPKPRPYAEIFVYSPRVEGIHLRGGKVARGGLRWSDRKEDFRTEVLGLMKAQMTKNAVIIPVGSKGGFVVKRPPVGDSRGDFLNEGIECYKTFLRGLLDVTDNIVSGKTVMPQNVVRYDDEDPYLVVAADKGTATFSDIANSVSADYGFWLGDAFASGGSAGYDHKKMGITARGAWVSVDRHFKEMGIDVAKQDFTVIGIGDMGGDVFGNGMLSSKHIKLVAAFNHLHIFVDPNPDSAESYKERKRLFKLPRSSWADYDQKIMSKGGGIFERSSKSIKISKEMKELFDVAEETLTPDELIKAILTSKADLLWNGGIGTYVKSRSETNAQVGDKANDILRVDGADLRAKVIGEGGNLGFTQLGRIEYARNGGRINTDAVDNSAGVDCSDHEVNIKIALGKAVESGKLTIKTRDELLESMTDEVAELVLRDNILQTQAITTAQLQGHSILESQARLMNLLESSGYLDRKIEFLPSKENIIKLHADGQGLTRPELAVMLAYSKIWLYENLIKSNLPDDVYYESDLVRYFPQPVQDKFKDEIMQHPLRREIIATSVTNSIINRIGNSLFYHLSEDTGLPACDIARAYTAVRDIFDLRDMWNVIEELTGKISLEAQRDITSEIQMLVERSCLWLLRYYPAPLKVDKTIAVIKPGVLELSKDLKKFLPKGHMEIFNIKHKKLIDDKIPSDLAFKVAGFELMASAFDIIQVANKAKLPVHVVANIYFELGYILHFDWLRAVLSDIQPHNYWERVSAKTLIDDLFEQQKRLASEVIKHLCKDNICGHAIKEWSEKNAKQLDGYKKFTDDLRSYEEQDISMIIVALRKIKDVCAV